MGGSPKKRERKIESALQMGQTVTAQDKEWYEKQLDIRAEERRKRAIIFGHQRDAIEQVGGGLTVSDISDEDLAVMARHRDVWNRIRVAPKGGGPLIPFMPNLWQKELYIRIAKRRAEKKSTRLIIVKGRQFGITTGSAGFVYSECVVDPGVPCIAVTNSETNIKRLARRYRTFIESDPWFATEPPPYYSVNNWQGANGSGIEFHLAGNDIRGADYRILHGTEVDFWPDFDQTMTGLLQSVSHDWRSVVILESTIGDRPSEGFRRLLHAVKSGQNTEWELWFLPWWQFPEYQAGHAANTVPWDAEIADRLQKTLSAEEKALLEVGAPLTALAWRRVTIQAECFGRADVFKQEYPATLEEALEYHGSWFFNRGAITWAEKNVREPVARYDVGVRDGVYFIAPNRNISIPHLRVWQAPDSAKRYSLGADVATSEDKTAARSDLTVIDNMTGEVVARWWGNVRAYQFAPVIHAVSAYYGNCPIRYDRTGLGEALEGEFIRLKTPNVEEGTHRRKGYQFTQAFQTGILGGLQKIVDTCKLRTPCAEQVEQMRMFTGDTKGSGWCDGVVSAALACYRVLESDQWASGSEVPKVEEDESQFRRELGLSEYIEGALERAENLGKAAHSPSFFNWT